MSDKLKNLVLKKLKNVPGVIGLASMDFKKDNSTLKGVNELEGIDVTDNGKHIDVSIAIIVQEDVNTKIITKEIASISRNLFKLKDIKLNKLNIYIRGVK